MAMQNYFGSEQQVEDVRFGEHETQDTYHSLNEQDNKASAQSYK